MPRVKLEQLPKCNAGEWCGSGASGNQPNYENGKSNNLK